MPSSVSVANSALETFIFLLIVIFHFWFLLRHWDVDVDGKTSCDLLVDVRPLPHLPLREVEDAGSRRM